MPKEFSSIVVFITSPVSLFKGAMVTEIGEKRDALGFEEALGVLISREPGLSLVLLLSRLALVERCLFVLIFFVYFFRGRLTVCQLAQLI